MPQPDAEGNEPSEEEKQVAHKRIEEVTKVNTENEKFNEEVLKIQSKVKISYRPPPDNAALNECALMRVNNFREQKADEADPNASVESIQNVSQTTQQAKQQQHPISKQSSLKQPSGQNSHRDQLSMEQSENASQALDNFQIEDIPTKMILVDPVNAERDINLIVYHSGKFYTLRSY